MAGENFIYLGSDTYLLLGNIIPMHDTADPNTGIAGAIVTADLFDQKSDTLIVAGLVLNDVAGAAGSYRGTIDNDQAGLIEHQRVIVEYTVNDGPGRTLVKSLIATVIKASHSNV